MNTETTKQKILTAALKLFAQNGYEAVSVDQIAQAVGVKAPSLYKHYKGKRDIFDHILARMVQLDAERARAYEVPEGTVTEMAAQYAQTPLEQIKAYSEAQFLYWTQDSFAAAFRRMLTVEQFRSGEMSALYHQYLGGGPMGYMADLFGQMTGDAKNGRQLALAFYAPMFLLYSMYDAAATPAQQKELIALLHNHIEHFAARLQAEYGVA